VPTILNVFDKLKFVGLFENSFYAES
jgi:hypothetical protein